MARSAAEALLFGRRAHARHPIFHWHSRRRKIIIAREAHIKMAEHRRESASLLRCARCSAGGVASYAPPALFYFQQNDVGRMVSADDIREITSAGQHRTSGRNPECPSVPPFRCRPPIVPLSLFPSHHLPAPFSRFLAAFCLRKSAGKVS